MDAISNTQWENIEVIVGVLGSVKKVAGVAGLDYQPFAGLRRSKGRLSDAQRLRIESALGLPERWLSSAQPPEARQTVIGLAAARSLLPEDNSPETQERRRENLRLLTGIARGAPSALCRHLGWVLPDMSKLLTTTFMRRKARLIEDGCKLPAGWLDQNHPDYGDLPAEFDRRLERLRMLSDAAPVTTPTSGTAAQSANRAPAEAWPPAIVPHVGPIARALVETLTRRANAGELSETDALEMLNIVAARQGPQGR